MVNNQGEFDLKEYKLNYLYDEALLSKVQRKRIDLITDEDGTDYEEFRQLKEIELDIVNFVENGDQLFIHSGGWGNGKTSWALRMIQAYFENIWEGSKLTCRALFINVPRFLLALKDNISEKNDYITHIKQHVLHADIVIWDEVGSKGLTEFEHENILSLINTRIDGGKANIYTANLSGAGLQRAIGGRLYSRIANMSLNIELKGRDKRRMRGTQG